MQWASASSDAADLDSALADVVARVRTQLGGQSVDLVVVFVSEHHRGGFERMGRLLRALLPHEHLLGASAAAVLGDGVELEGTPGLAILAGRLPDVDVHPFHLDTSTLPGADDHDGWQLAVDPALPSAASPAFLVLADPITFDPRQLVAGLDGAFPASTVVGGLASGGEAGTRNTLWLDADTWHHGAVGVALTGNIEVETIVAQGCRPIGEPMFVTRAAGSLLHELDGRPALQMLSELVASAPRDEQRLMQQSLFVGLAMRTDQSDYGPGDFLVRNLAGAIREAGALVVGAELDARQVAQFHVRDAKASHDDLEAHLDRRTRPNPRGALLFSCLGRGAGLYGVPHHDSRLLRDVIGETPIAGFFGNGEIGPVQGQTFIHGYTSAFALFHPADTDTRRALPP